MLVLRIKFTLSRTMYGLLISAAVAPSQRGLEIFTPEIDWAIAWPMLRRVRVHVAPISDYTKALSRFFCVWVRCPELRYSVLFMCVCVCFVFFLGGVGSLLKRRARLAPIPVVMSCFAFVYLVLRFVVCFHYLRPEWCGEGHSYPCLQHLSHRVRQTQHFHSE